MWFYHFLFNLHRTTISETRELIYRAVFSSQLRIWLMHLGMKQIYTDLIMSWLTVQFETYPRLINGLMTRLLLELYPLHRNVWLFLSVNNDIRKAAVWSQSINGIVFGVFQIFSRQGLHDNQGHISFSQRRSKGQRLKMRMFYNLDKILYL